MSSDPLHLHFHLRGHFEDRPVEVVIDIPLTRVILALCFVVPSTTLTVAKIASSLRIFCSIP